MTPAAALTNELLLALTRELPQICVWRNNRIDAMAVSRGKLRRVSAGINGQADLSGIIAPSGRRIEIEIKAGKDRQSPMQTSFEAMITACGGVYLICRNVPETLSAIRKLLI